MKFRHRKSHLALQPGPRLILALLWTLSAGAQPRDGYYNVLGYGAKPDGTTPATRAINQAIIDCSRQGGGTVLFPPGRYRSASLALLDNVTLQLEAGAILMGSSTLEDYPLEPDHQPGEPGRAGLITARHAHHVAITGQGVVEGSAMAFVDLVKLKLSEGRDFDKKYTRQGEAYMDPKFGTADGPLLPYDRPGHLFRFIDCTNVQLSGVTLQNSPAWNVEFVRSEQIDINGIAINASASGRRVPNDDGIDLVESRDAHISNCDIENGDDGIAVLGGSERVAVDNCTLASRSTAVRVGFAGGDIRDCVFANLLIHDSNRGLGVYVRGPGSIENILFSDIVIDTRLMTGHWWGKAEPIHVSAILRDTNTDHIGRIKNICFRDIMARSESGILIHGCAQSVIQGLEFQSVKIRIKNGPLQESYGGNFDLRANRDLQSALFVHDIPAFYCRYASGLKIHGLAVAWDSALPAFFSHGIELEDFENVVIDGFTGGPGPGAAGQSAIALSGGHGLTIRNSQAAPGTGPFISFTNISGGGLLIDNDLRKAGRVSEPEGLPLQASGNLRPKRP